MLLSYRKSYLTWIAIFAFLYAAATPLFAALHAQPRSDYLGVLCTLDGAREVPGKPAVPGPNGAGHPQQCVFCVGGAWQPPPDVSLSVPVLPVPVAAIYPVRDGIFNPASEALQPLSPRAPPRLV